MIQTIVTRVLNHCILSFLVSEDIISNINSLYRNKVSFDRTEL